MTSEIKEKVAGLIIKSANLRTLKKAIFSKSLDKSIIKTVITLKDIGGATLLQSESFFADNKAKHKNTPLTSNDVSEYLTALVSDFMQVNVITTVGDCEYRRAASGKETVIGGDKLKKALESDTASNKKVEISGNNKEKAYILSGNEPFLIKLGVSDQNGRPHDKKRAKLRQINRFLEYVRDTEKHLPSEGVLHIADLCCGKSYLSFAVYHYFTQIKKRDVVMTGVDLKSDVIEYCNKTAKELGFDGLTFICGDVLEFSPAVLPSLVVSLHACDIATDIVLAKAIEWRSKVVLSTPCCHHFMNHHLNCGALSFIAEHSMLKQKFCDAATDSLRLKLLQSEGYSTEAVELVDPDDTPKNILLRAVLTGNKNAKAREEYEAAYKFLYGENL